MSLENDEWPRVTVDFATIVRLRTTRSKPLGLLVMGLGQYGHGPIVLWGSKKRQ